MLTEQALYQLAYLPSPYKMSYICTYSYLCLQVYTHVYNLIISDPDSVTLLVRHEGWEKGMQRPSFSHRNSGSWQISPFKCSAVQHCHTRVPVAPPGVAQIAMKDEEGCLGGESGICRGNTQGMKPDSCTLKGLKHLCTESTGKLHAAPLPGNHPQIFGLSRSSAQNALRWCEYHWPT